jgi:hypothetical protein
MARWDQAQISNSRFSASVGFDVGSREAVAKVSFYRARVPHPILVLCLSL